MGLPLGPAPNNAFLCFCKKMWLEQCLEECKPVIIEDM